MTSKGRQSTRRRTAWIAAAALLFLAAGSSRAVDGVIEINAARATAGGVTPGDAPGFPVTLDAPGSYRLTSDLVPAGSSGIEIAADGPVTLDLNGFSIRGPGSCSLSSTNLTCSGTLGVGIDVLSPTEWIVIRNGQIHGMAAGIDAIAIPATIENVSVWENGGRGIEINGGGRIAGCRVERNGGTEGIYVGGFLKDILITNTSVYGNKGNGINTAGANGVLRGNVIRENGGWGLVSEFLNSPTAAPAYTENHFTGNSAGNVRGGTGLGDNLCGSSLCP